MEFLFCLLLSISIFHPQKHDFTHCRARLIIKASCLSSLGHFTLTVLEFSLSPVCLISPYARDNSLHINITAMHKVDTPPLLAVCYQPVSNQAERGTAYRCEKSLPLQKGQSLYETDDRLEKQSRFHFNRRINKFMLLKPMAPLLKCSFFILLAFFLTVSQTIQRMHVQIHIHEGVSNS